MRHDDEGAALEQAADRLLSGAGRQAADCPYPYTSERRLRRARAMDMAYSEVTATVPAEWPAVFQDLREGASIDATYLLKVARKVRCSSFDVDCVDLYLRGLNLSEVGAVLACDGCRVRRALDRFTVAARAWFSARGIAPASGVFVTGAIYRAPVHCAPGYERCARTGICPYRTAE